MTVNTFRLEIVNAEEEIFSGLAQKLFIAGIDGEMEVLPNHAPLITLLAPGPVWVIKENGDEEAYVIFGGLIEVQPKHTIILADAVMRAADIDAAAALNAKKHAEDMLVKRGDGKINYAVMHNELAMALAQLRILRKLRKG